MPLQSQIALRGSGNRSVRKPPPFCGREDAGVAPFIALERTDIEDVDDEDVAGLGAGDLDRPEQMMAGRQVAVADIGGVVVVLDLTAGPVESLDDEIVARLHRHDRRDVRMPAIVQRRVAAPSAAS